MKSTGIVRRIDDLGRIVIPKNVRRSIGIEEGEPMELFLDGYDIVLRRYDYSLSAKEAIEKTARMISTDDYVSSEKKAAVAKILREAISILNNDEEVE